jgi:hypothetical protein
MTKRLFPAVMIGFVAAMFVSCGDGSGALSGTGVAGSTSRFAVVGDYLYVLNEYRQQSSSGLSSWAVHTLDTFSLEERSNPFKVDRLEMDSIVAETLHAVGENLFVGTTSGMQIISLAVPEKPETLSFTGHFTSRDPVVVVGSTAYVTLRTSETSSSGAFSRGANQLQILDVSDLENPQQLSAFEMTAPWGLGVRHDRAYVCDGSAGLRVLNVSDPQEIPVVASVSTDICFDVLVTDDLLVSTGAGGVNQYYIESGSVEPVLLSTITIQP